MLDIRQISDLLPHRFPFLLVDRVLELFPGQSCKAVKNVTFNEPFFTGHFPGLPTMPGVLILESMAQTGALILMASPEHLDGESPQNMVLYLAGMEKVRFRKPVVPGDVLVHEVRVLWHRRGFGRIAGVSKVDDEVVAEAEIAYSLSKRSQ
jgi:3-hydroxyacyl-[acyl-carrier-protein] dehydratase